MSRQTPAQYLARTDLADHAINNMIQRHARRHVDDLLDSVDKKKDSFGVGRVLSVLTRLLVGERRGERS